MLRTAASSQRTSAKLYRSVTSSGYYYNNNQSGRSKRRCLNNSSSSNAIHLSKVLIANRGEIACRVIRTCQRWGIPTVAVYSNADGPDCLHAKMATEAVPIGTGPSPAESYLRQEELLTIIQQTGAQAVHPGYGFLSENYQFAQACQDMTAAAAAAGGAGVQFVGPPASAIRAMGSKSQAKAIMDAAGVPTTPGYYQHGNDDETNQEADFLKQKAIEIGFPLLIKAVLGGGGKGMRIVWNEGEFDAALESCQMEAQAAFGNAQVLLEKYVVGPRHVEVQVMADTHGNTVHLYERDCSMQRRHQKVIEEAPASDLPLDLRQQLGDMAVRAAQAVGYVNAGTVEFLLDPSTLEFYFMEMNTRLQVEHPVTECITGIDLVEWQLRVAAGEALPLTTQAEIPCKGHAMEARIYAEHASRNFLPATGKVWHHAPPPPAAATTNNNETTIRVDTGLQVGQEVGVYYDPMISKLIVHGPDRTSAVNLLISALQQYQIAGVPTNIDFLIKCADHAAFRRGSIDTGFLQDYADDLQHIVDTLPSPLAQAVGALAVMLHIEQRVTTTTTQTNNNNKSPWSSLSGSWRMGGEAGRARRHLELLILDQDDQDNAAPLPPPMMIECISNRDGSFEMKTIDANDGGDGDESTTFEIAGELDSDGSMSVLLNGTQRLGFTTVLKQDNNKDGIIQVRIWPKGLKDDYFWSVNIRHPLIPRPVSSDAGGGGGRAMSSSGGGRVKAPMPGKISRVNVSVGDAVEAGDVVLVMEAMKMEHAIKAPCAGTLTELNYQQNDIVQDGAWLFVVQDEGVKEEEEA